jgi:hypothetical protein
LQKSFERGTPGATIEPDCHLVDRLPNSRLKEEEKCSRRVAFRYRHKPGVHLSDVKIDFRKRIDFFPAPSLHRLKTLLSTSLPQGTYISINDALSALSITCLIQSRFPHPPASSPPLDLALTLDGRRLLSPPLPQTWLGNLTLHAQISAPLSAMIPPTIPTLSALALRLRERILKLDTAYV